MHSDSQVPREDYRQADLIVTLTEDSCLLNTELLTVPATPCSANLISATDCPLNSNPPQSYKHSSLTAPFGDMPGIPQCEVFAAANNKPSLTGYRCVPGGTG